MPLDNGQALMEAAKPSWCHWRIHGIDVIYLRPCQAIMDQGGSLVLRALGKNLTNKKKAANLAYVPFAHNETHQGAVIC